jgi:amino acid transporter
MGVVEARTGGKRFNWKLPLYAMVGATIVMLWSFVYSDQPGLTYVFLIVPIVCLFCLCCLVIFVVAALRKRPSRSPWVLLAPITFLVVAGTLLTAQSVLRPSLRWLLWSHRLKAEVLAQPTTANGELKHVEWDGFGGTPVGDWTIYVVFDPTDSLSVAAKDHRSGSYKGIPCEVESVRRLESHWYSVTLGMNEWWDRCG